MKAHICGRIAAVAVFLLVNHTAVAQSETSEECMRKIGGYDLNFNAYQAATGSNRFCDDIPLTGPTVLTIDFVHSELRQMPAEAPAARGRVVAGGARWFQRRQGAGSTTFTLKDLFLGAHRNRPHV